VDWFLLRPEGIGRDLSLSHDTQLAKRWMKAELHSHCSLDPVDYRVCQHTPEELITHAARLGYEILAITCHDTDVWTEGLADYARGLGITLIPGMEVSTEGTRQILAYNFRAGSREMSTLARIRSLCREDTLVIAPHPFFPGPHCLRELVRKNLDIFDAIEYSGFYIRGVDFNRRGEALAAREHKPLVGNADVHHLWQMDRTFTWVYAEPGVLPVIRAVKEGLVKVQKSPLTWFEAAKWWTTSFWRRPFPANPEPKKRFGRKTSPVRPSDEIEDGRCLGAAQQGMKP